jgi:hypothetical protein
MASFMAFPSSPLEHESTNPKRLLLSKVITRDIPVNRMARRLEGNIEKSLEGEVQQLERDVEGGRSMEILPVI